ncbi:exocyst complex component EXO84B isoform X2 [Coffea arabica]|uniref:Exocyst complex component EXO84B isoform X2 n=1 Tax=Coffea arabica TaxID=13443 RepID=A0A6P6UVI1_COFAR|nr:exocyst complex component EXO84C-like isoform X2 [Coffea arabica]
MDTSTASASSSAATTSRRFRFRDPASLREIMLASQDSVNEDLLRGHTSPDYSSSSSGDHGDVDDSELESMTAKGIQNLCSELLELKNESDEDFQKSISSNYAVFLRTFKDMEGLESELMRLKYQAATQKRVIKDLQESISLKVLSEEIMESMLEESFDSHKTASRSLLEAHTEDISEILDILLSEHRLGDALSVLEMEGRAFQSMRSGESFSSKELMSYNSAISEKKAMLEDQFTRLARNPRVSAPELQKALLGLCRLGSSYLAIQLLLDYYDARIVRGTHDLNSSKAVQNGLYIQQAAKFIFSMISQAARSFVALHGEASSYTPELILWANEHTEALATCLAKYVESISEINGGLSIAAETAQFAIAYCSLLDNQNLDLRSCLTNRVRPSMEQVLRVNVHHYKRVISIFTSNDSWIIGRYLVSGILSKGSSVDVVDKKPEYCLLTNSGRKLVTLFQAITDDSFPLLSLQMEVTVLRELMELFTEYTIILEKALSSGADLIQESGSSIQPAESLVQGVCVIANSFTLGQIFSNIIRCIFGNIHHLKFEIDNYVLYIQDTHVRLRAYFLEQIMQKLLTSEGSQGHVSGSCITLENDSDIYYLVPSMPYQGLYLELRKLQKFAEDNYIELDWLLDVLRELMEAIFFQIANREEILTVTNDLSMEQKSRNLMQFLVEIARSGGYLSHSIVNASMETVAHIKSGLYSSDFTLASCVNDQRWAADAAMIAMQKLDVLDEKESATNDMANNLEGETIECESQHSTDSFEDDESTTSPKQSIESPKNLAISRASEMPSHSEKRISETENITLEGDILDDSSSVDCSEPFKERLRGFGRDEINSRNPNNDSLETLLAEDNFAEASMDEISSLRERNYTRKGLPINTSGTLAKAEDLIERPQSNHGENNGERTSAVLKED